MEKELKYPANVAKNETTNNHRGESGCQNE